MYRMCILNKIQLKEFNKNYSVDFQSVMIKQEGSRYYAILDCDIKIKLYEKEALKYFSN